MAPIRRVQTRCPHMRPAAAAGCDDEESSSLSAAASTTYTLKLPYTSYRGAFIGDHYRLQQLRLQTEFLDIFSVVCLCGRVFEAQAFSLSCPCRKLLESRRRRMKRIYRSDNFVDVFEQSGKRFLVTKVDRTEKEWRDVCEQVTHREEDFASDLPARLIGFGACCGVDDRVRKAIQDVYGPCDIGESAEQDSSYVGPTTYAGALRKGLSK